MVKPLVVSKQLFKFAELNPFFKSFFSEMLTESRILTMAFFRLIEVLRKR